MSLVDVELRSWLEGAIWLPSDQSHDQRGIRVVDATPYEPEAGEPSPSIVEVTRAPHALTWAVPDPFARFLVHCTARFYGIVSFSKVNLSGQHIVFLMRHLTAGGGPRQPGSRLAAPSSLATPPTTDFGSGTEDDEIISLGSSISELEVASTDDEGSRHWGSHQPRSGVLRRDIASPALSPVLSEASDLSDADGDAASMMSSFASIGSLPSSAGPVNRTAYRSRPNTRALQRTRSASSSPSRSRSPPRRRTPRRSSRQAEATSRPDHDGGRLAATRTGACDPADKSFMEWVLQG